MALKFLSFVLFIILAYFVIDFCLYLFLKYVQKRPLKNYIVYFKEYAGLKK